MGFTGHAMQVWCTAISLRFCPLLEDCGRTRIRGRGAVRSGVDRRCRSTRTPDRSWVRQERTGNGMGVWVGAVVVLEGGGRSL
jgi:hypothetical protein